MQTTQRTTQCKRGTSLLALYATDAQVIYNGRPLLSAERQFCVQIYRILQRNMHKIDAAWNNAVRHAWDKGVKPPQYFCQDLKIFNQLSYLAVS